MKIALITGVNGFVGKHLARELHKNKLSVIGVGYEPELHPELIGIIDFYYSCDLTDKKQVDSLEISQVDYIFSLAGLASVGKSFKDEKNYVNTNVAVFANLAEKLVDAKSSARVLAISSGAVYGTNQQMPLSETSMTSSGSSPYVASKLAMEKSAKHFIKRGLDCIVVRPFNHIGPGQESGFLVPDLFDKILAAIQSKSPLIIGDLTTQRDYTDVRDVVRAYYLLATTHTLKARLYNVCSMHSVSGEAILEKLLSYLGNPNLPTRIDKNLVRPHDPPLLLGDNSRLAEATGWSPSYTIDTTLQDFIKQKQISL